MKKIIFFLLATNFFLVSCLQEKNIPTNSNSLEPDIWEIQLVKSNPKINGTFHYELKIPAWDEGSNYTRGPKLKIKENNNLYPITATADGYYLWKIDVLNSDISIEGAGHYQLDPITKKLKWGWKIEKIKNSKYFQQEKQTLEITFRDGKISPINVVNLNKLKAIIWTSASTIATGEKLICDASHSISTNSKIMNYEWDFNGDKITGIKTEYIYLSPGKKKIILRITDKLGNIAKDSAEIKVIQKIYPQNTIGDDYVRFSFDFVNNKLHIYCNFDKVKGKREKEYIYGNFAGPEQNWILYDNTNGLIFDEHHKGWAGIAIELKPVMDLSFGYSGWYEGSKEHPDFTHTYFNHLSKSKYYVSPDIHVIIYSSGQVKKYTD